MKSKLSIILMLLIISGCLTGQESSTKISDIKTKCIDGVTYIIFSEMGGYDGYGFMSVKFNADGTVSTCN